MAGLRHLDGPTAEELNLLAEKDSGHPQNDIYKPTHTFRV